MKIIKSPGGSMFPYYYKGGEIHCLKYGSFHSDINALEKLMKEEEDFIKASNKKLRIWIDFYETKHTRDVFIKLIENIKNLNNNIFKLSIVGLSVIERFRFKRLVKKSGYKFSVPISFYEDPEEAKTWLVS